MFNFSVSDNTNQSFVEIRNHINSLTSQNITEQKSAVRILLELVRNPENKIAIVQAGAISILMELLLSAHANKTMQKHAAKILTDLAYCCPENQIALAKETGLITLFVSYLLSDDEVKRLRAAKTFVNLTCHEENEILIGRTGIIPILVDFLNDQDSKICQFSVGTLRNLVSCDENKAVIVDAGAIPLLIFLLSSNCLEVCEDAANILAYLSRVEKYRAPIIEAGALDPLKQLANLRGPMVKQKKYARYVLEQLCFFSRAPNRRSDNNVESPLAPFKL